MSWLGRWFLDLYYSTPSTTKQNTTIINYKRTIGHKLEQFNCIYTPKLNITPCTYFNVKTAEYAL
jgi:hypothetical protein